MYPPRGRRSNRFIRIALISCAVLVVVLVTAVAAIGLFFDPNDYKAEIAASVKRATGRDFVINGRISIAPSLEPTIRATNVSLANIPGGSQPQMLTVGRVEAEVELLPLLRRRLVLNRVVLVQPKLLLETDRAGKANWMFVPENGAGSAATGGESTAGERREAMPLSLQSIHIRDAEITWRDNQAQRYVPITIARLDAGSETRDGPMSAKAEMSIASLAVTATADIGSLERLQDRAANTPWPVRLDLEGGGVNLAVSGSIRQPLQGRGYTLLVDVATGNLATFGPVIGRSLPPLHDFALSAHLSDTTNGTPTLTALTLNTGYSDLNSIMPGLKVDKVEISAGSLDEPVRGEVSGEYAELPLHLKGTFASPGVLLGSTSKAPLPVDVAAEVAGAQISAKGTIASLTPLSGLDLAGAVRVPDLAAMQRIVRRPLPLLRNFVLQGHLTDAPGGPSAGVILHGATLTTSQGDLAGDTIILFQDPFSVRGSLTSTNLDFDSLIAAIRPMFRTPATEPEPAAPPTPAAPPPAPAAPGAEVSSSAAAATDRTAAAIVALPRHGSAASGFGPAARRHRRRSQTCRRP